MHQSTKDFIPNPILIAEFKKLVEAGKNNENELQTFLEQNSEFLPTCPHLHHHGLHLDCVISKFPMGRRTADFADLTKTSNRWRLVLVELESPAKKMFLGKSDHVSNTVEFTHALDQIRVWREYWDKHQAEVSAALAPLLVPTTMRENRIELKTVLVYGRSVEVERSQRRRDRLVSHEDGDLIIQTYDTLLRNYEGGREKAKIVLSPRSTGFAIKYGIGDSDSLFASVYPEHLEVSAPIDSELTARGYDMASWRQDKLLNENGRRVRDDNQVARDALEAVLRSAGIRP